MSDYLTWNRGKTSASYWIGFAVRKTASPSVQGERGASKQSLDIQKTGTISSIPD